MNRVYLHWFSCLTEYFLSSTLRKSRRKKYKKKKTCVFSVHHLSTNSFHVTYCPNSSIPHDCSANHPFASQIVVRSRMFSKRMLPRRTRDDSGGCRATCLRTYLAQVEYLSMAASLEKRRRLLLARSLVIWSRGGG